MGTDSENPAGNGRRSRKASAWFAMPRAEALALLFLFAFSIVSFLPLWRDIRFAGMSVFGWLMAALMLISPVLMLVVFRSGGGRRR